MSGTWHALNNQPKFNVSTMLLLTDGTVMCQESGARAWWRLSPGPGGGYLDGAWAALAPMHHSRLYYASAVLADGRVFVAGGEYSDAGSETTTAEIYDPKSNSWMEIAAPAGWNRIGDAPCTVLPDGRVLVGQIDDARTAIYDAVANTWTPAANKGDASSEESWVLMPDGTILVAQCSAHPGTEKYLISANNWMPTGQTPSDLVEGASIEIGPGVLLPDGRALFIGATPHTALYTPGPAANAAGTWAPGPAIPHDPAGRVCGAKDAPACLTVGGHVLLTVGPVDGVSGDYLGPTYFYEFDGKSLVKVPDAPNAGQVPFVGRMLLLPTGDILYAAGTPALYAYSPTDPFQDTWRPEILTAPAGLYAGLSYTLSGRQLNGLSQAVGYGDDASAATNYPLVRLRSKAGQVRYCETFGHSTMGVGTGTAVHTTNFLVPSSTPPGSYELTVIANGIPSKGLDILVEALVLPFGWDRLWAWLIGSLADGPLWAIGPNGPVPVDPMGAEIRAQVRAARVAILDNIKVLEKIGKQVDKQRLKAARAAKPVTDPEFDAFVKKHKKSKSKSAAKVH